MVYPLQFVHSKSIVSKGKRRDTHFLNKTFLEFGRKSRKVNWKGEKCLWHANRCTGAIYINHRVGTLCAQFKVSVILYVSCDFSHTSKTMYFIKDIFPSDWQDYFSREKRGVLFSWWFLRAPLRHLGSLPFQFFVQPVRLAYLRGAHLWRQLWEGERASPGERGAWAGQTRVTNSRSPPRGISCSQELGPWTKKAHA